jgi:hypothetical protein
VIATSKLIPCPDCRAELAVGSASCPECGIRLTGPDAVRLWAVDQQLERYAAERVQLIERLRQPAAPVPPAVGQPPVSPRPSGGSSPSGQQLLLGLGALLLLSAATFLGVVMWMTVGVWGQALLLVILIALSVAGAVMATRRRLPAAAETGAVLASGLTGVGLWAAWTLNLGGLSSVPAALYASLASAFAGLLLLGFDRTVPRSDAAGKLRPIFTYRPVATAALALSPWLLLAHEAPTGVVLVLGFLLVAMAGAGLWWLAERFLNPDAAVAPLISAGLAVVAAVVAGALDGFDVSSATRELSVLVVVALLVVVAWLGHRRGRQQGDLAMFASAVVAVPLLWSLGWEVHWAVLLGVCVALALIALALALAPWGTDVMQSTAHQAAQVFVALLGVALLATLAALHFSDELQLVNAPAGAGPSHLVVAGVAAVWVVAAAVVATRLKSLPWLVLAHLMLVAVVVMGMLQSGSGARVLVWLGTAALLALVSAALEATRVRSALQWPEAGVMVLVFGSGFAAVTLALALSTLDQPHQGLVFLAVGFIAYVSSLVPGRLRLAYAGAFIISTGTSMLAVDAGMDSVETFTWPLALLLATVGWRHWSADRSARSMLTMGPALSAALLPSTLAAVFEGDAARLALVTLMAVALLVLGLTLRLKAPVVVASVCLAYVGITQGGPVIAELPAWFTLGTAGLTLLAVGVSWERAVLAGRRGSAWFAELR